MLFFSEFVNQIQGVQELPDGQKEAQSRSSVKPLSSKSFSPSSWYRTSVRPEWFYVKGGDKSGITVSENTSKSAQTDVKNGDKSSTVVSEKDSKAAQTDENVVKTPESAPNTAQNAPTAEAETESEAPKKPPKSTQTQAESESEAPKMPPKSTQTQESKSQCTQPWAMEGCQCDWCKSRRNMEPDVEMSEAENGLVVKLD